MCVNQSCHMYRPRCGLTDVLYQQFVSVAQRFLSSDRCRIWQQRSRKAQKWAMGEVLSVQTGRFRLHSPYFVAQNLDRFDARH